jgi:hypothetical protein
MSQLSGVGATPKLQLHLNAPFDDMLQTNCTKSNQEGKNVPIQTVTTANSSHQCASLCICSVPVTVGYIASLLSHEVHVCMGHLVVCCMHATQVPGLVFHVSLTGTVAMA